MVCRILTALIIAGQVLAAETPAVTAEATVVTVKESVNYKPQLDAQTKEINQLKNAQSAMEKSSKEISARLEVQIKANEELLSLIKKQDGSLKIYSEKIASLEKTLEGFKAKLDLISDLFAGLNKKLETEEMVSSTLKISSDSFKVKLDIMQDDIKIKSDEIRNIKDSISMNKGNVDSVISDNIDMKRQLREINAKASTKTDPGILGWEHWGVVATGVGVLALIIAVVK